jgi:hypothetical protein
MSSAAVSQAEVVVPEAKPNELEMPSSVEDSPSVAQAASSNAAQLAARAQQKIITLKDSQARSIEVEILEIEEDTIKVRRQSDRRIVEVPVKMLSSEDQVFAAYLWKDRNSALKDQTDTQKIFDELFGGF